MRFVLVHGGFHGAWCWEKVVPELEALGHQPLAIDLPGHGERVDEKATLDTYRQGVVDVIEDGDVVVGHSMGGPVITLAADAVPERIGRLVYLAAMVPVEGQSMIDVTSHGEIGLDQHVGPVETPANGPCFAMRDIEGASAYFYHDCSPEDQQWAFERLTPQPFEPVSTPISAPSFWASNVPRSFILCTDDRSHPLQTDNEFMRRLGLQSCAAIDSSHSPFLSKPRELARLLDLCAAGVL